MNWGGFPIGFRFPVEDFSLETKKRCWSYVVPALRYADLTDSTLLEAESAELFDPDLICTAEDISFENVRFAGERCVDESQLIRARHLTVNEDYPNTIPRGGTGCAWYLSEY